MSESEHTIMPISASHMVANGALIVVCGAERSGKTRVVENLFNQSLASFVEKDYPPLYVGAHTIVAQRYFGTLFEHYSSPYSGAKQAVLSRCHILQYGNQHLNREAEFKRQGEDFADAKNRNPILVLSSKPMPRIVLYIDSCDDEHNFIKECLEPSEKKYRETNTINILETLDHSFYAKLDPSLIIFTSKMVKTDEKTLKSLLQCKNTVIRDLVQTANNFIRPKSVALVINLHQWRVTEKKRGFHIFHYTSVPCLATQLNFLCGKLGKNKYCSGDNHSNVDNVQNNTTKIVSTKQDLLKTSAVENDNANENDDNDRNEKFHTKSRQHHRHNRCAHNSRRRHRKNTSKENSVPKDAFSFK